MLFFKASTAADIKVGPFLDDTDGITPETGLTMSAGNVRLSKNGGDFAAKVSSAADLTHDEFGYYFCSINVSDVGNVGNLQIAITASGALPVYHEGIVLPAQVYDSLIGGSDTLQVDVTGWNGNPTTSADVAIVSAPSNFKDLAITATDGLVSIASASMEAIASASLSQLANVTRAEPGQGAPAVSEDPLTKLDYLYKFMRNKVDNDGTTIQVYDDAGTTVDQKSSVSESGGTVTRGEFGTGP